MPAPIFTLLPAPFFAHGSCTLHCWMSQAKLEWVGNFSFLLPKNVRAAVKDVASRVMTPFYCKSQLGIRLPCLKQLWSLLHIKWALTGCVFGWRGLSLLCLILDSELCSKHSSEVRLFRGSKQSLDLDGVQSVHGSLTSCDTPPPHRYLCPAPEWHTGGIRR